MVVWSAIYPLETGNGNGNGEPINYITSLDLAFNNNFTDTSTFPKTVNNNGATFSSSIVKNGSHSLSLNGVNHYVYLDSGLYDDFYFKDREFTIEAWTYPTDLSGNRALISKHANNNYSWMFLTGSSSSIWVTNGSYQTANIAFSTNQWQHVAISKVETNLLFFKDGVLQDTLDDTSITYANNSTRVEIGRNGDVAWYWAGYIDSLKIVKGTGLYTENFTPL